MSDAKDGWVSNKGSGDTWNPTKEADGTPKFHATEDDILQGYYIGMKENVGQNNANVYTVETDQGAKKDVWGTTALNDQMSKIRVGAYIMIQWHGKKLTKAGQAKFKSVEVCNNSTMAFHDWEVFVNQNVEPLNLGGGTSGAKPSGASAAGKTGSSYQPAQNTQAKQTAPAVGSDDENDLPF